MGRLCSICRRPDAREINQRLARKEVSARALAHRLGVHVRVMQHHAQRHLRGSVMDAAGRRRRRHGDSLLESLLALSDRALAILATAEASRSHSIALQAIREARGTLELVGRTTGEISAPGQTTVNVALGVSVERAKAAVEIVDQAEALSPAELADRAEEVLRLYNSDHPDDARIISASRLMAGTDAEPQAGERQTRGVGAVDGGADT